MCLFLMVEPGASWGLGEMKRVMNAAHCRAGGLRELGATARWVLQNRKWRHREVN